MKKLHLITFSVFSLMKAGIAMKSIKLFLCIGCLFAEIANTLGEEHNPDNLYKFVFHVDGQSKRMWKVEIKYPTSPMTEIFTGETNKWEDSIFYSNRTPQTITVYFVDLPGKTVTYEVGMAEITGGTGGIVGGYTWGLFVQNPVGIASTEFYENDGIFNKTVNIPEPVCADAIPANTVLCLNLTPQCTYNFQQIYYISYNLQIYTNSGWSDYTCSSGTIDGQINRFFVDDWYALSLLPKPLKFRVISKRYDYDEKNVYYTISPAFSISKYILPAFPLSELNIQAVNPPCQGLPIIKFPLSDADLNYPYLSSTNIKQTEGEFSNGYNYQVGSDCNPQDPDCVGNPTSSTVTSDGGFIKIQDSNFLANTEYSVTVRYTPSAQNSWNRTVCTRTTTITIPPPMLDFTSTITPSQSFGTGYSVAKPGDKATITVSFEGSTSGTNEVYIEQNGTVIDKKTINSQSYTNNSSTYYHNPNGATIELPSGTAGETKTYSVYIKNGNLCETTHEQVTVTTPPAISFTANSESPTCHSASLSNTSNGKIEITNITGIGEYCIKLYNSSDTEIETLNNVKVDTVFKGLTKGTYKVKVGDYHENEPDSVTIQIADPAPVQLTLDVTQPELWCGNGSVTVSVNPNVTNYRMTGKDWQSTNSFAGIPPSTSRDTFYVKTDEGCIFFDDTIIQAAKKIIIKQREEFPASCDGKADGSISFEIVNISDFTISETNNLDRIEEDTIFFKDLQDSTEYSAKLTATAGAGEQCDTTFSFTTKDVTPIVLDEITESVITPVSDKGSASGSVTVSVKAGTGTPPYRLTIKNDIGYVDTKTDVTGDEQVTFTGLRGLSELESPLGLPYTVKAEDANGCEPDSMTISILEPSDTLRLTAVITDSIKCFDGKDATIQLTVTGGWGAPFIFKYKKDEGNWTDLNSSEIEDLSVGKYIFCVEDKYGGHDTVLLTITQPDVLEASFLSKTDVLCFGNNTGELRFTATGGSKPYKINNQVFEKNGQLDNSLLRLYKLPADRYDAILIQDRNKCEVTVFNVNDNMTITQPDSKLTIGNISTVNPNCADSINGVISGTVSGGTGLYRCELYELNGGNSILLDSIESQNQNNPIRFDSLMGGQSYRVKVVDANLCVDSTAVIPVYQPTNPAIDSLTIINELCYQQNNGSITARVNLGALNGNTVQLGHVQFTGMGMDTAIHPPANLAGNVFKTGISPLAPGDYYIQAFDINGCPSKSDKAVVKAADELQITVNTVLHVKDKGSATGVIDYRITGGTGTGWVCLTGNNGYRDSLQAHQSRFGQLRAGVYRLDVADINGCSHTLDNIEVKEPADSLCLRIVAGKGLTTCEAMTGSVTVEASGGWGGYKYSRSDQNGVLYEPYIGYAGAGSFTVTVTDSMGGTASVPVRFLDPKDSLRAELLALTAPAACDGNGKVKIRVSGGIAPYTVIDGATKELYRSSDGHQFEIDNATSGVQTINISDSVGCPFTLTTTLTDTALLRVDGFRVVLPSTGTATDGSIHAIVSGMTDDMSCIWENVLTGQTMAGDTTLHNVSAGRYRIRVGNNSGCTVTGEYADVAGADAAEFELVAKSDETGWRVSDGKAILTLARFHVEHYTLSDPQGTTISFDSDGTSADGRCSALRDTVILNGLQPGDWMLTGITDTKEQACYSFTITEYKQLVVSSQVHHLTRKGSNDGNIMVTAEGGAGNYRFAWTDGTGRSVVSRDTAEYSAISNLAAGIYSVTVTDRYGHTSELTDTVAEPEDLLGLYCKKITDVNCAGYNDGYVELEARGGWGGYKWRSSNDSEREYRHQPIFTFLRPGSYSFHVIDKLGQSDTLQLNITEPEPLRAKLTGVDSVLCRGGATGRIECSVSGGSDLYRIAELPYPVWNSGTILNGLPAGMHRVVFTDSHDCPCADTLEIAVYEPDSLKVALTALRQTTCGFDNGSMTAGATGGTRPYSYQWRDSRGNALGDAAQASDLPQSTTCNLTVTDANGCTAELQERILSSQGMSLGEIAVTPVICHGDTTGTARLTSVHAASPYAPWHLEWSNGIGTGNIDTTLQLPAGRYHVTARDTNGCVATRYFDVVQPDSLFPYLLNLREPHCYGYSDAQLATSVRGGTAPYTWLWSNGDTTASLTGLTAGNYRLVLFDANGCHTEQSYDIGQPEELFVELGDSAVICPGNSYTIDGLDYRSYRWFDTTGEIAHSRYLTVGNEGNYRLEAVDERGCVATGSFRLNVDADYLHGDFLLSSGAVTTDTLMLVELSDHSLDSLRWEFDTIAFTPLTADNGQTALMQLYCRQAGMYNIGMYAYANGCLSYAVKQVEVLEASAAPTDSLSGAMLGVREPLITSFNVYPNPNNGQFKVEVKLREPSDIRLTVFYIVRGERILERKANGADYYLLDFNIGNLMPGVYLIMVTAGNERKQGKMVVE